MATGVVPASGSQNWLGYALADQTNYMDPAAATDYLPVDSDKTAWDHDPKRVAVAAASGTIWANGWVVDEDGTVKFTVGFPLFHEYGQKLIFAFLGKDNASGGTHTAELTGSKYLCFEVNEAGVSTQLAGMKGTKLDIETQSKGVPMVTIEYEGTVPPVEITPSVTPGTSPVYDPATDQVYSWPNFGSATLLADGANVKTIDSFGMTVGANPDTFYGNTGTGLPSDITETLGEVTGKFTKLLKGTTNEILRFIQNGRTPGTLAFGWSDGTDSVALTLANSVYKTAKRTGGAKKQILEDFTFESLAPAGQVPLTYVVHNGHGSSYVP